MSIKSLDQLALALSTGWQRLTGRSAQPVIFSHAILDRKDQNILLGPDNFDPATGKLLFDILADPTSAVNWAITYGTDAEIRSITNARQNQLFGSTDTKDVFMGKVDGTTEKVSGDKIKTLTSDLDVDAVTYADIFTFPVVAGIDYTFDLLFIGTGTAATPSRYTNASFDGPSTPVGIGYLQAAEDGSSNVSPPNTSWVGIAPGSGSHRNWTKDAGIYADFTTGLVGVIGSRNTRILFVRGTIRFGANGIFKLKARGNGTSTQGRVLAGTRMSLSSKS
jgi:hypothetical protein